MGSGRVVPRGSVRYLVDEEVGWAYMGELSAVVRLTNAGTRCRRGLLRLGGCGGESGEGQGGAEHRGLRQDTLGVAM